MEIKINNCGVIVDTSIRCNGLTVITGKNGSGKTTLVKSVVALLSSLNSYDDNILDDVKNYVRDKLGGIYEYLFALISGRFFYYGGYSDDNHEDDSLRKALIGKYIFGSRMKNNEYSFSSLHDAVEFLQGLLTEFNENSEQLRRFVFDQKKKGLLPRALSEWEDYIAFAPKAIQETLDYLSGDHLEEKYLFESTKSLIDFTFSGQIIPFNRPGSLPEIRIEDNGLSVSYAHNVSITSKFSIHGFRYNCFYIDDGNMIDDIDNRRIKRKPKKDAGSIPLSYYSLRDQLLLAISSNANVFSAIENKDKNAQIFALLDEIWPHSLSRRKGLTINSDNGLSVSNEASGAKVFIILKTLLTRGYISERTLLIFDEPENHLHPDWQNKFAEIIAYICQTIGAKIICITHSPSMLLALDVYSKLLKIRDRFTCYFGEATNRAAHFDDVTNSIEIAHDKMNEPYIWMDSQDQD